MLISTFFILKLEFLVVRSMWCNQLFSGLPASWHCWY